MALLPSPTSHLPGLCITRNRCCLPHTQMQLQRADDRLKNVGKEERDQRLRQLQRLHEEAAAVQKQHVGGRCGWLWLVGLVWMG